MPDREKYLVRVGLVFGCLCGLVIGYNVALLATTLLG